MSMSCKSNVSTIIRGHIFLNLRTLKLYNFAKNCCFFNILNENRIRTQHINMSGSERFSCFAIVRFMFHMENLEGRYISYNNN